MAHQNYNHQQYNHGHGQSQNPPPVQTQNLNHFQPQRPFSPPSYQQSPTGMSPNTGSGIPPAKRQRLSPNPPSPAPYHSPFAASPYPQSQPQSPYVTSPQYPPGHLSVPPSPVAQQPPPFHQPQPFQHTNGVSQQHPPQGSMPPPKMPYSKAQDDAELEKPNGRDSDVNNLSDVLSGSGVDLRAEEDLLLHSYGNRNYGASFNSQATGSTVTPNTSFNNWSQQGSHGAYQGTGPLSQSMTQEQHEAEFLRKHEQAARILNESAQQPLTDPFLSANVLRHRIAKRAYETGIQVNVDGLFDKIPEKTPRDTTRTVRAGSGEQIVGLEAASLLNSNASLVEILSLLALAAEERVRGLVEDAFALSQGRQHTSHGVIPPQLVDIAVVEKDTETKMVAPVNILRTPWEASDGAVSPKRTASKQPPNAARLPTPPSEAPPTPQRTYQSINRVANALKRKVAEDERYEKERLQKRQKRQQGTAATPVEAPTVALPPPDKMTKKDKDALKKHNQTDEVLYRKTNETASMALGFGKKKKYSWMTGGGGPGGGSGASTPRPTVTAAGSGTATPVVPTIDKSLQGRKRTFGTDIERTDIGARIQVRDLVHVLEHDGREKKTLALMLARLKNTDKDERKQEPDRRLPPAVVR
ncbi:transcription initiation factor TFIID component TAF4 family-domain-containing protein [Phaeosphaeriaceae sp. PMI808]|nr:transcription initiation factor TFIID component TAF4 family-domain-containing protein [Phaeosphaeriaceae sp. PMI808]